MTTLNIQDYDYKQIYCKYTNGILKTPDKVYIFTSNVYKH